MADGESTTTTFDDLDLLTLTPECAGVPLLLADPETASRSLEYFTTQVRSPATREAYSRAIRRFFVWCEDRGVTDLHAVSPMCVAAYIEQLGRHRSAPTVKRALAAIRSLFDWLASGGCLPANPAAPVRGPRHVVVRGTTPVLTVEETRHLIRSIPADAPIGLRDRALIAMMVYTFARVSAATGMRVDDYFQQGRRWFIRLHEKNGRLHQVPAHSKLQEHLEQYLHACGLDTSPHLPLFRSFSIDGRMTVHGLTRNDALRMVKRRAVAAGLAATTCCHSFRATGITAYLSNGGLLETAQALAGHA
ncbi:MAG: tyrosine-type recombinase/integrase, partial [Planctomycetota bacterium]